ncbi:BrnT family toxin [Candidatus Poribacteria bacterium]|nr:BrnT family toxin [Candidatus Poribacteria bacterium]
MNSYRWDNAKNEQLKEQRGIGFEQIVMHVERGDMIEIVDHPNRVKYPHQKMLVVNINNYVHLVPFVQNNNEMFLKTIIPSRKATNKYLRGEK